ncbi:MAG TPA: histidine kinase, partial [Roseateles sp.]
MTPSFSPSPQQKLWIERWQRFSSALVRYFHIYAGWLVGISWKRFVLLSLALLIGVNVLKNLPPFTWRISEQVEEHDHGADRRRAKLEAEAKKAADQARKAVEKAGKHEADKGVHYEVKAAQAAENAESEALKRQVIEARMAAMQAQVEPHFLFNTLASIDHLIEV